MTATDDAGRLPVLAHFCAWSPVVAGAGLSLKFAPSWVALSIWLVIAVCLAPFRRVRPIVYSALAAYAIGWLLSVVLTLTAEGVIGFYAR